MKDTFFNDTVAPIADWRVKIEEDVQNDSDKYRSIRIEDLQKDSKTIEDYYSAIPKTHQSQSNINNPLPNNDDNQKISSFQKLVDDNDGEDYYYYEKEKERISMSSLKKPEQNNIAFVIFYVLICIFLMLSCLFLSENSFLIICVLVMVCINVLLIYRLNTFEHWGGLS